MFEMIILTEVTALLKIIDQTSVIIRSDLYRLFNENVLNLVHIWNLNQENKLLLFISVSYSRNRPELSAWPAACQAPGGLAGQAPVQDEFW
jgi:hypothetical protein